MRCTMCGKKMALVKIDEIICWQCPGKTCRHVEPPPQNVESAKDAESANETDKKK